MSVQQNTFTILGELQQNALKIDDVQAEQFIAQIKNARHIFLQGAGRSGIAIRAFANRLLHLGFSVSVIGDISTPHTQDGDLVIIGSGSGETGSLVSLAKKADSCGVNVVLVTMKAESTIGKLASSILVLPGTVKEDNGREEGSFSQPMGSAFEQLCFITYDAIVLELMSRLGETSDTMFQRHANLE
ncbi:6-phospho-3-hexuloisomerase [Enterobacter huaxiensis]|jgi:6-phospho-3-hexuloisomerase|uniref:SIS domain-containing protein n=1 Tax=Enterobacter huaxiensis TaxID=2494702 RepID=A0ABU6EKH7_9ENTR|nr:6-phospho-3-hexuloisomerase [Enterobacter huaxiensis]MEB7541578.1 SIS domain-containing protein [Enterobacter huaxiensis]MEB7580473.1 SIS domain-containing protein [Enterobacter huaxiensis]MEB7661329.1 SIS domain-containing protein [Enterobacter huaxiensis]